MEQIIPPVRKRALKAELKKARHIPEASRGILQSYLVDAQTCPLVVQEIGRLREIAFREKGGGTGKAVDLGRFDLDPSLGFRQLLVWNILNNEIMGGYRILTGNRCKLNADGQPDMPSSHLFKFSDTFIKDVLPVTSELSRSYSRHISAGTGAYYQNGTCRRSFLFRLGSCRLGRLRGSGSAG